LPGRAIDLGLIAAGIHRQGRALVGRERAAGVGDGGAAAAFVSGRGGAVAAGEPGSADREAQHGDEESFALAVQA